MWTQPGESRRNPHVSVTLLTLAPLAALLHIEKENVTGSSSALRSGSWETTYQHDSMLESNF